MDEIVIYTSEKGWLKLLAVAYKKHDKVTLIDDAEIGVNPSNESLFEMGRKAKIPKKEFISVCVALGMSTLGALVIAGAFIDPEPTTKLGFIVGSGVVLIFGGGYMAIKILTKVRPPNVEIGRSGFKINWDNEPQQTETI